MDTLPSPFVWLELVVENNNMYTVKKENVKTYSDIFSTKKPTCIHVYLTLC